NGPSTFLSELLDQLYQMNDITYKNQVKKVEI
ncbi:MAG: hydroxyethylthiazole kinase, partial [Staphylococcus sp.]|nr:hydroxyethylthiazole kinase [Staphylococcus sp.]